MFKAEFPPTADWFAEHEVQVDLGFQGIEKDYTGKAFSIPHKKPKQQELTQEQKAENKSRASQRVTVEHSICGLKRYRILSDRLRMHDLNLYNDVLEVCAGLWRGRRNRRRTAGGRDCRRRRCGGWRERWWE